MKEIIINLSGIIGAETGSEVYLKVRELVSEPHRILLDMGGITEIDGPGQAFLEKIRVKADETGSFAAACCKPDAVPLETDFPLFPDRPAAIQYLTACGNAPEGQKDAAVVIETDEDIAGTEDTAGEEEAESPVKNIAAPVSESLDIYCPGCGKVSRQKKGNGECPHCGVKLYIHSAKRVSAYEKLL